MLVQLHHPMMALFTYQHSNKRPQHTTPNGAIRLTQRFYQLAQPRVDQDPAPMVRYKARRPQS